MLRLIPCIPLAESGPYPTAYAYYPIAAQQTKIAAATTRGGEHYSDSYY
jgi:hypothetical protein